MERSRRPGAYRLRHGLVNAVMSLQALMAVIG